MTWMIESKIVIVIIVKIWVTRIDIFIDTGLHDSYYSDISSYKNNTDTGL